MRLTCLRFGVAGGLVVLLALTGCAPQGQKLVQDTGVRINAPGFLDDVRGAASADGEVARATDDQLVNAAVHVCHPSEDAAGASISINGVVLSDRTDVDALLRAAHRYVCP